MGLLAQLALTFVLAFPGVSAHYFFPHFIADGNYTEYFEYVREDTQGFMPYKGNYDSTDLRCNVGSQDFAGQTGVYKVKAGAEIGFGSDFNALIQHPGPLQVYMSKAPGDVHEYDGSGDWFKIYELGPKSFGSEGIEWGVTDIGNFTFTLPKETPAGQYLVRIEHVALHGAGDYGGAELYFNCAQIEVESDSVAVPEPVVKIPGVYTGYEPGIMFYMYRPYWTNYTMPGPKVWPNGGDSVVYAEGISVAPDGAWSAPAVTPSSTSTTPIAIDPPSSSSITSSSPITSSSSITPSSDVSVLSSTSSTSSVLPSAFVSASSSPAPAVTAPPTLCVPETITVTATETTTIDPTCNWSVTVTTTITTTVTPI